MPKIYFSLSFSLSLELCLHGKISNTLKTKTISGQIEHSYEEVEKLEGSLD